MLDLDQTIADLHSYFFPLSVLQLSVPRIDHAYFAFVHRLLREEVSPCPIGLLRPGLLAVMEQYAARVRARELHPLVIYSNNSYLPCLHLVRDVINKYVGFQLIDRTIHWNHPVRAIHDKRGAFTKTWTTLRAILGPVNAADVMFFDDQSHPHLEVVLGPAYCRVTPYRFRSSFDRVMTALLKALDDAEIDPVAIGMAVAMESDQPAAGLEELIWEYAAQLGDTADAEECPMGECGDFWSALRVEEYNPSKFLDLM